MAGQRDPNRGMVFAREACVITVGAVPPTYETFVAINNRTGEPVTMRKDEPVDQGTEGMAYTFKQYQRVPKSHPAVKDSPSSFVAVDELDDAELELVTS